MSDGDGDVVQGFAQGENYCTCGNAIHRSFCCVQWQIIEPLCPDWQPVVCQWKKAASAPGFPGLETNAVAELDGTGQLWSEVEHPAFFDGLRDPLRQHEVPPVFVSGWAAGLVSQPFAHLVYGDGIVG